MPVKPHHDCPSCPECALAVGVGYDRDDVPLPPPGLWCPACGCLWQGTAEDRAQADRADAAWQVERKRQWMLPGMGS